MTCRACEEGCSADSPLHNHERHKKTDLMTYTIDIDAGTITDSSGNFWSVEQLLSTLNYQIGMGWICEIRTIKTELP